MADDAARPGKDADIDVLIFGPDPSGRTRAFEKATARYRRPMLAFVIVLSQKYGRWLDPEDAVQETFVCFIEKVNNGQYEPQGKVGALLYSIARNRVANFGRQRRRERIDSREQIVERGVLDAASIACSQERSKELRQAVLSGMDTLKPKEWAVYTAWLDLFDEAGKPPTLDRLVDELYASPTNGEHRKKLKECVRKTRDRAQAKLCNYLKRRGFWP